jgi:hypothetical protein
MWAWALVLLASSGGAEGAARRVRVEALAVEVEAPQGWQDFVRGPFLRLSPGKPSPTTIALSLFEPAREASYQGWSSWTRRRVAEMKATFKVRRQKALKVDGHQALRLDMVVPPAAGDGGAIEILVETWIAVPSARQPDAGRVIMLTFESAGPDTAADLQVYERVLASLRF